MKAAALVQRARTDVAASFTRRAFFVLPTSLVVLPAQAALFGPLSLVPKEVRPAVAVASLLDGRDALADVVSLEGSVDGRRARTFRRLPRLSKAVQNMVAYLPMLAPASDEAAVGYAEAVLIGAQNVMLLAKIASQRSVSEDELPQRSFVEARDAADALIKLLDPALLLSGSKERCRRLLAEAFDVEEMRASAFSCSCYSTLIDMHIAQLLIPPLVAMRFERVTLASKNAERTHQFGVKTTF